MIWTLSGYGCRMASALSDFMTAEEHRGFEEHLWRFSEVFPPNGVSQNTSSDALEVKGVYTLYLFYEYP